MAYQEGVTPIGSGVSSVAVTFPSAFVGAPDVVIFNVINTVDASILQLQGTLHIKSANGFTVELTGVTDSGNYVLVWMAGSMLTVFQTLTAVGRMANQLPVTQETPGPNDLVPFMAMYPLPATKTFRWSMLTGLFARPQASAPTAPNALGSFGDMAVDATYLYFHDGTQWVRIPREPTTTWTTDSGIKPRRAATVTLTSGQKAQTVTFTTPFTGTLPKVTALVISNVAAGDKLLLYGMVTAITLNGFEVTLSSSPDSADYKLTYTAEQT